MEKAADKILKLSPEIKDYIWGGVRLKQLFGRDNGGKKIAESWEVSVHPDGPSGSAAGTLAEYLSKNPQAVDCAGNPFPVLIKYIDAKQNLSVQVHPDDGYARRIEGDNGKTEMWYILEADDGAGIYCGFKRDTCREEFLEKVKSGTVEELLNFIPVKKGDCFLIEAGTVHAIGAGCVICEVQQSSNVTYRVYDYNRKDADGNFRALHVDKAVDVINFNAFKDNTFSGGFESCKGGSIRRLTECRYFRCRELLLDGEYCGRAERSFVTLNVIEGSGKADGVPFECGDSFFVPCGKSFSIKGRAKIIITDKGVDVKYYAGIDLGGTFIKGGIVSSRGELVIKDKIPTDTKRPYIEIIKDMAALVNGLSERAGVSVEAVGIGSPGTVDSENGVIVYSNNFGWSNVPLAEKIGDILGIPVFITNDANAAALGESFMGAGKDYKSMVLVTLGTGVGGGIVLYGKLFEGGRSAGAELGHTVIRTNGEKCTCGRRGCLEAYASATALINSTKAAMINHPESYMWRICGGEIEKVDGKTAFDATGAGDKTAAKVVRKYIRCLGEGITDFCNIFRPGAVLLGGGVCAQGDTLLKPLKKFVADNIFGGADYAPVEIRAAALGNDAGIYGAVRLAMGAAG